MDLHALTTGAPHGLVLAALIVVLSVVQGLFGVGLLVFGTPTLLLLGYPFETALAYLLPCSVVISAMQVLQARAHIEVRPASFGYALPPLFAGLALVLTHVISVDIKLVLGIIMVLSVAARISPPVKKGIRNFLMNHTKGYLALMGGVHGVSNMGGALLTILAATLYDSKERIRANIACWYLIFGLCQLTVLALLHPDALSVTGVGLAAIALVTYGTFVQLIYLKTSEARYQSFITALMLCYGLVLLGHRLLS